MNTNKIVKPAQNNNGSGQPLHLPESVLEDRPHSVEGSHTTKAPFDSEIPGFREQYELLSKYTSQAKYVIISLFYEDNREELTNEVFSGLLWIVQDRLDDIEKVSQELWETVTRPTNGEIVNEDR